MNIHDASPRVAGRGFQKPVVSFRYLSTSLIVRVEDNVKPEMWFELELPVKFLEDACTTLLKQMLDDARALNDILPPPPAES